MTYPLTNIYLGFIERIPFFHFCPGSPTLTIGTYGCNLDCSYCMNQHLLNEPAFFFDLSPKQVVDKAILAGASLISFSANEPAVDFDYFMDIARQAKEAGISAGCSTNGLFSAPQLDEISGSISFANVSIKGPSTEFYRDVCRGGSLDTVIATIERLVDTGVHVEITTPYVPLIKRQDMIDIASRIAGISRDIPWHIFRLLPEYKYTRMARTEIVDMISLKDEAGHILDYIYLENFANSIFVDTVCPGCSETVIKRVSTGGCGATIHDLRLIDKSCPRCSRRIHLTGEPVTSRDEEPLRPDPRKGIIDVGGWRSTIDMATCLPVDIESKPPLDGIIAHKPYPGDMKETSDAWVSDMALALIKEMNPELAVITYSQCAFVGRHREDEKDYRRFVDIARKEINRLIQDSGYEYLIVGLGDMVRTKGVVNIEKEISGIASADEGIACLYHTEPEDVERLSLTKGIRGIYSRDEFGTMTGYDFDPDIYGDYFVVPEQGYRFLALSSISRFTYRMDSLDREIPVFSSIPVPSHITGIRKALRESVRQGKRVLLVIVDGVGKGFFPFEPSMIDNTAGGIPYASSMNQYLVISTGEAFCPYFYAYPNWKSLERINPFSRHAPFLKDCLSWDVMDSGKKAVSVGNRSIMTHTAFPADVSLECHCSALHNYGTLEVLR